MFSVSVDVAAAQQGSSYSKAVQKARTRDYHKHGGQYGIETEALRLCMDRVGRHLSKSCIDAPVAAG
jgi:hypothetical protein